MKDLLTNITLKKALKKLNLNLDSFVVECGSTQNYAKEISVARDTVIVAKEQAGGIGRLDRKFLSKVGGCYFTLVLTKKIEKPISIIPIVSVAIATVLESYTACPKIKWPNDILIGNKKICGFLCNTSGEKTLIGIGINVFNDISEINDIATSLYNLDCKRKIRAEIIAEVLQNFYMLLQEDFSKVIQEYKSKLNILGKQVRVFQRDKELSGKVIDVDGEGFLILQNEDGKQKIMYGDIIIS